MLIYSYAGVYPPTGIVLAKKMSANNTGFYLSTTREIVQSAESFLV
jgi:hypothetical protein